MQRLKVYTTKPVAGRLTVPAQNLFGGFTLYDAAGGWQDADGVDVHEPVSVLEIILADVTSPALIDSFLFAVQCEAEEFGEDEVLVTIEGGIMAQTITPHGQRAAS